MESVPAPGEWHPWYQDKLWLMNWLNDHKSMYYRVPIMPVLRISVESTDQFDFGPREVQLSKRRAWTFAPWAEQSYVYAWYIATDTYGRQIAGDSWIEYIKDYDRFLAHLSEWVV